MKLQPEELEQEGYQLLDELSHQELLPFVRLYLRKKTIARTFYYFSNFLFAGLLVGSFWWEMYRNGSSFETLFAYVAYGIALTFTLLPLHEYIHVLAYRSQGAKNTSYDANLRKFYFMALAHRFVCSKKEFIRVALAPFAFITGALLLILLFVNNYWSLSVTAMVLTHTAMCSGDFALISYFQFHHDKTLVTYDDTEKKVSYFFSKQKKD